MSWTTHVRANIFSSSSACARARTTYRISKCPEASHQIAVKRRKACLRKRCRNVYHLRKILDGDKIRCRCPRRRAPGAGFIVVLGHRRATTGNPMFCAKGKGGASVMEVLAPGVSDSDASCQSRPVATEAEYNPLYSLELPG